MRFSLNANGIHAWIPSARPKEASQSECDVNSHGECPVSADGSGCRAEVGRVVRAALRIGNSCGRGASDVIDRDRRWKSNRLA